MISLLRVENLSLQFGGLKALDGISFTAEAGAITAIIGPNGAGKTSLFNCLTGFYKPQSGSILLHDDQHQKTHKLHQLNGHQIASQARVARSFQNIRLFGAMTVLENLLVAFHHELFLPSLHPAAWFGGGAYAAHEKHIVDEASEWLRAVGLLDKANHRADQLSYGWQKRLEIARAMALRPRLLCLDEPAAGLNHRESEEFNELLQKILDQTKIGILLIEHDMHVVMNVSDHIVVLDHGQKIAEGNAEEIRAHPEVIAAYLGQAA